VGFRFQFRRSIKILPGVRWNISKGGSSFTFGGRGFRHTIGKRGARTTVGIPGTGLSYTKLHKKAAMPPPPPTPQQPTSPRATTQRFFYVIGTILLVIWLLGKLPQTSSVSRTAAPVVLSTPPVVRSSPLVAVPVVSPTLAPAITMPVSTPPVAASEIPPALATPDSSSQVQRAAPVRQQDDLVAQFRQTVVYRAAPMYPDLLNVDSPLFRATWSAYYQHKVSNPAFFNDPDWPLALANQTAAALRIPPRAAAVSSTAANTPQSQKTPKLVFKPQPAFPYNAGNLRRPASGRFLLKFKSDGAVAAVETVQSTGNAVLDASASATLRLWRSEPGQNWSTVVPITFETRR
jgi:TonB family protein